MMYLTSNPPTASMQIRKYNLNTQHNELSREENCHKIKNKKELLLVLKTFCEKTSLPYDRLFNWSFKIGENYEYLFTPNTGDINLVVTRMFNKMVELYPTTSENSWV